MPSECAGREENVPGLRRNVPGVKCADSPSFVDPDWGGIGARKLEGGTGNGHLLNPSDGHEWSEFGGADAIKPPTRDLRETTQDQYMWGYVGVRLPYYDGRFWTKAEWTRVATREDAWGPCSRVTMCGQAFSMTEFRPLVAIRGIQQIPVVPLLAFLPDCAPNVPMFLAAFFCIKVARRRGIGESLLPKYRQHYTASEDYFPSVQKTKGSFSLNLPDTVAQRQPKLGLYAEVELKKVSREKQMKESMYTGTAVGSRPSELNFKTKICCKADTGCAMSSERTPEEEARQDRIRTKGRPLTRRLNGATEGRPRGGDHAPKVVLFQGARTVAPDAIRLGIIAQTALLTAKHIVSDEFMERVPLCKLIHEFTDGTSTWNCRVEPS
ncbi:hypothetical protein C8R47DRAFT_1084819 [Mycena vitilis]|nr:hypothetical protein C8R47DRAFT_1084819 [Mycena vitilis]